jgi:signal transduction histidine kinase
VSPFGDRELAIVTAFAGQAAMAINGVKLVQELQAGRAQLARTVDELEALRKVGEAVSSSLDVDQVLSTIAMHAVELSGTGGGSIMEYDDLERRFVVRSVYRTSPEVVEQLRGMRIDIESTLVGRAAKERRPIAVPDLSLVDLDPHLQILFDNGWRSVVAVPMLLEEQIIGSLVVRRRSTGDFTMETLDLLETFATQSALALLNAQLFTALQDRTAQLEVASRHKSEFLASMSHELRTPLNAMLGFSEVLLERMFGDINERQEEYLRDIYSSGKHLLELLNEILDLSKVEAGQMELTVTSLDVPAALEYAASMLKERATAHSIDLRIELGEGVGAVQVDELRFKQVVLNLVSNAVKFTPDGGSVVIWAVEVGKDLHVTVTDTGVGIPSRTANASSSRSSRAAVERPEKRARVSASHCRAESSSCSAAGCGC